jgi:hypothetical protein
MRALPPGRHQWEEWHRDANAVIPAELLQQSRWNAVNVFRLTGDALGGTARRV